MNYIKKKPGMKPKTKQIKHSTKAACASIDAQAASLFMHSIDKTSQQNQQNDRESPELYASSRMTHVAENSAKNIGDGLNSSTKGLLRHIRDYSKKELQRKAVNRIWTDFKQRTAQKTAQRTTKTTAKAAKASAKTTAKTVKATAKAAARAVNAARKAAIEAVKAIRLTVKVALKVSVAAAKAIAALGKAIIALISSVGWPALVIIAIIAAVGAILASPFGIVIGDEDESTPQIQEMVVTIENELEKNIEDIISRVDPDETIIEYISNIDNENGDNWADVLAIYAVKTTMLDRMDVVVIDEAKQNKLREVFWDMNVLSYRTETEKVTTTITGEDGEKKEVSYTRTILYITIDVKDYKKMFWEYAFDGDQIKMTEELLDSDEFNVLVESLIDRTRIPDLTPEEFAAIQSNLPPNENSSVIVNFAISLLGTPYSRMDCSKYVQLCYEQIGVQLPRTAAAQAKYCVDNNCLVNKADLQPGDLIFFSHRDKETGEFNDRYLSVSHVAIYVSNGMMIDSSASNGKVVYRGLIGGQVLYGRP